MKEYEKETQKLYSEIEQIWPDNNSWYDYTRMQIIEFIYNNQNIFNSDDKILNAGSGGTIYDGIQGEFFHVDISDKFIKHLPNSFVSSIENLPFDNEYFNSIICVGSVINYCNALTAISEMYRILKHNSYLILEYERSQTGELLFKSDYGKSTSIQIYQYNNQKNHKLWLYSDRYIDIILKNIGFQNIKNQHYHVISSIFNRFLNNEIKSGLFAKYDKFIPRHFQKLFAHNRILLCYKK